MQKLIALIIITITLFSTTLKAQIEPEDLLKEVNTSKIEEILEDMSVRTNLSVGLANGSQWLSSASQLGVFYRQFGVERISFLGVSSIGANYLVVPKQGFSGGLGWNSNGRFPTLTLGFSSQPLDWDVDFLEEIKIRSTVLATANRNILGGREPWLGLLNYALIQPDWEWFQELFGKKSQKHLVVSVALGYGDRLDLPSFRAYLGIGFQAQFSGREALELLR